MLFPTLLVVSLSAAPAEAAPGAPAKPKLIVLAFVAQNGAQPDLATLLEEATVAEVSRAGYFQVIGSKDVQTLLGLERQKQLLGCSEDSGSCMTELAGALGARFVLTGSVSKLGDAYQLTLQTLDSQRATTLGRSVRLARDEVLLRKGIAYAASEATGTPAPPPPSRVVPYSMVAVGGLLVVGGGVIGMDGLSRERAAARELELGEQGRASLKPRSEYAEEARFVSQEKTVGLLGLAAGGALVGFGLYLVPDDVSGGGVMALVPRSDGAALVGAF